MTTSSHSAPSTPSTPSTPSARIVDGVNVTLLAASWVATLSPNRIPLPGHYNLGVNITWTDGIHRYDETTYIRLDNPPVNVTWQVTDHGGFPIAPARRYGVADRMADAIAESWIHGVWEGTGRVRGQPYRWRIDRVELLDAEWPQGDDEFATGWAIGWTEILELLAERLSIQTDPAYYTSQGGIFTYHVIE